MNLHQILLTDPTTRARVLRLSDRFAAAIATEFPTEPPNEAVIAAALADTLALSAARLDLGTCGSNLDRRLEPFVAHVIRAYGRHRDRLESGPKPPG